MQISARINIFRKDVDILEIGANADMLVHLTYVGRGKHMQLPVGSMMYIHEPWYTFLLFSNEI